MSQSQPSNLCIRLATISDLQFLPSIEQASDQLFRTVNMGQISDLEPAPPEAYQADVEEGKIWVCCLGIETLDIQRQEGMGNVNEEVKATLNGAHDEGELVVGFICIRIFEAVQKVFISQVSVCQEYTRRGIGRELVQRVEDWALREGFKAVELTTFRHVPFNRPYYERLEYRVLSEDELKGPGFSDLKSILEAERNDELLGQWERVGMRKVFE